MQHRRLPSNEVGNSGSLTLNFGFDANSIAVYLPIPLEQPVISTMVVILPSLTDNLLATLDVQQINAPFDDWSREVKVWSRDPSKSMVTPSRVFCSNAGRDVETQHSTRREQNLKICSFTLHRICFETNRQKQCVLYFYNTETGHSLLQSLQKCGHSKVSGEDVI